MKQVKNSPQKDENLGSKKSAWSPKRNFLCMRKMQEGSKGIFEIEENLKTYELEDLEHLQPSRLT
jgi:hypothetical protein